MSTIAADWDAAQARLHGLRSRRPAEADWVALDATLGLDEWLARARQPPFGRWIRLLSTEPALHEVDRVLRAAFRDECVRLANWYGVPWNGALARLAAIVDLPLLSALAHGADFPAFASDDPVWRELLVARPHKRLHLGTGLPLTPRDVHNDGGLFAAWLRAWLASLPTSTAEIAAGFNALARAITDIRRRGVEASPAAAPMPRPQAQLALLFRRYAGTPVAMACEVAATAFDMQQLRAGLVRRLLTDRAASVAA